MLLQNFQEQHEDKLCNALLLHCNFQDFFKNLVYLAKSFLYRNAVDEKVECVAKCTEQICTAIVEETLNADITVLVEDILEAKLQCIRKYIER